jgi:hypothetical protein
MSVCVVCGMWLYVRIGEPASAHGTVDSGKCSGWLEPTVSKDTYAFTYGGVVNDPVARECEGCNAEPNEPCREGCLSLAI